MHESCLAACREATGLVRAVLAAAGRPGTLAGALDAIDTGRAWELSDRPLRSSEAAAATGRAAREFQRPVLRTALADLTTVAAITPQHS